VDSLLNNAVLVLNSGMVPIAICTVRKAVLDIFREIAIPIRESDSVLRSPSISIPVPVIISHIRYHKIPGREKRFSKVNVMYRDNHTCVYCKRKLSSKELTVDHVIPKSRWQEIMGEKPVYAFNSWENLVTACNRCNSTKSNRLIQELGWKLDFIPGEPYYMPSLVISRKRAETMGWLEYCAYNVRLM